MTRRVTGGKVFEQMTVPSLRKRVALDQGAQKGFNRTDEKYTLKQRYIQGVSKKTESSGNHYNFCYRPRIILFNMSFRMRKARPVHLRHKNYIVKHFNCLKIGRNGRRQRGSYLFSDLRISVKMSAPTFAAAFKAVKMLKHLVFMS